MSDPCIICVAITGSVPRKADNPAVPVTVAEQIESTHAAFEAGASICHAHVRNADETPSSDPDALKYVLDNLAELVVKEVHGSGGYGMLVGPAASKQEIEAFRAKLKAKPDNYIAQPTLALSTVPILTDAGLAPRHVDLRPFALMSTQGVEITPGGLTRVALSEGSLIVNSSQGGGTKDTWVLED